MTQWTPLARQQFAAAESWLLSPRLWYDVEQPYQTFKCRMFTGFPVSLLCLHMLKCQSASAVLHRSASLFRNITSLHDRIETAIMASETEKRNIVIVGWPAFCHQGEELADMC